MKTKYILCTLYFVLCTCSAQPKKDSLAIDKLKLDTIDITNFKKNYYEFKLDDSTTVEISSSEDKSDFVRRKKYKNSFIEEYAEFNTKGKLVKIGKTIKHGRLGIWREYDDMGNLIKETNEDKDFPFTYEQVLQYCKDNNIDLTTKYAKISRGYNNSKNKSLGTWYSIEYQGIYDEKKGRYKIELDGKTGEKILVGRFHWRGPGYDWITIYDREAECKKSSSVYKNYQIKNICMNYTHTK